MSKALQALEDLSKLVFIYGGMEQYKLIEKALKALEIITKKMVIPAYIVNTKNVEEYNKWLKEITLKEDWLKRTLTKEEYDLLKEILVNENF